MGFMQRFEERVSAGKNSGKTQSGAQPGFIQRFERRLGGEELSQTARDTAARYQKIFQDYDWKSGLEYDEWDEEDQQRKAAGQLPKAIEKKYDFDDPIDVYLYQNGLPPKKRIASYAKAAETKQAATQLEQQKEQVVARNLVAPVVAGFTGIPAETLQKGLSAQQQPAQRSTQQPAQKSDKQPKPYALPTPQDIEVDTVSGAAPTGRKALEQMAEDDPERKTGLYKEYENPLSHQKTWGEMTAREAMVEIRRLEEEQKKVRTYQQEQAQRQERQTARLEEMTSDPNWLFEVRKGATMELPEEFQRSNLSVYERNQNNPYADAGRYRGVHRYWDYFTQDEKNYYFYLRGKGDEEGAQAYYDDMLDELKSRWTKEDLERAKAKAQKDPFAASLESVALNVTAPIRSAPYVLKQAFTQDTINPYDPSFSNALGAQTIREEVGGTIESPFLRFLYDTGMGTLDFAATAPFGEVASLAIMGTNAFANTAREASAKGATTDEAFALGLISGAAEVLTEKAGLERLYGQLGSKSSKPIRQALTEAAKSALSEGTEEIVSEVVNTVADLLIMGDKADLRQAEKEYMAQGLSESDAKKQALEDWIRDGLLMSYAGGAVGGLMMSGPAILVNKIATDVRIGQDIQQSGGVSETLDMARDAGVLSPVQYENAQKKAPSARKLGSIAANTASAYVEALKQAHSAADLETRLTQANEQLNTQISEIENGLPTPETEQRLAELTEQQRDLSDRLEQVKQNRVQYNEAEQVAKKLGAKFELDGLNVGVGKYENGTITIDPFQANPVRKVLVHELTHHLETSGRYGEVQNMALELFSQKAGVSVDQLVNNVIQQYGSQGIALDAEGAKSELTALFCESNLFQSPSSIQTLAAEKPGLFQRMWQWVKDTARKVKGTAAEKQMVNLERIYREAMWDVSGVEEQAAAETAQSEQFVEEMPVSEQIEAENEQQELANVETENADDELERIAGEILRQMQGQQLEQDVEPLPAAQEQQRFDTTGEDSGKAQYAIITQDDGSQYVQSDRKIDIGNDPKKWSSNLEKYINNEIRKGNDVAFLTSDGHVLVLTERSAYKLSDTHEAKIEKTARALLSESDYRLKAEAAAHIDELIQIGKFRGFKEDINGAHANDVGEDGFNYFTAFFRGADGQHYRVPFSSGINEQGETVYSIGKIRERTSSEGRGPSVPLSNGAQLRRGSDGIVYQSAAESQEKSSFAQAYEEAQKRKAKGSEYSLGLDMEDVAQTDTEGKQLSPAQQEFFQNSKARLLEEDGEYYLGKGNLAAVQRVESARFSGGLWNASADQIGYYFNTSKSEGAGETVYLNLQNPLTFYTFQDLIDEVTRASKLTAADFASDRDALRKKIGEQFRGYLEENGSDGAIIMEDENFGGTSFIALDPAQIYGVNDSNLPIAEQTEAAIQNTRIADTDTEGRELSPKQREFFANSAVTDENGRLKVMYHGTNADVDFTVFDAYNGAWGLFGNGLYFTDHLDVAESYTKKGRGHNPRVYEVYLDIQNPIDMDAPFDAAKWRKVQEDFHDYDFDFSRCRTNEDAFRAMEEAMTYNEVYDYEAEEEIIGALRYMGYDGITHAGGGRVSSRPKGYHTVYIAFDAEQIKSVDNRNPTKTNPDIRYSLGWTLEDFERNMQEQMRAQEGLPNAEVEELPNAETARDMEPSERVEEQRKEAAQTERTAEEVVEGELIQEQTESTQEEQEKTARETAEQGDPLEEMERSDDPELSKRAKTYKKRYERKFVDAMGDVFSLDPSVKRELRTELSAIAAEAMKTGQMTEETKQQLFDEMMDRGMILNASLSESHEGALEFTKQKLSPAGLESDTRKALFGKLRYDNNGLRIDVAYQEMSEQWPDLFPTDITNPNDQAKRIAEVKQELQGVRQSLMEYYGDADQYGEFRREAYNQFDKELYKLRKEMGMIERYETAARNRRQERADLIAAATDAQQARAALEQRNALRKELEKAERKTEYPLSDADRSTIRALIDGGLTEADVQGRTNAKDLLRVAEAQKAYEANEKIIKEAGKRRVRNSAELVDELLKTSDKWKDKGNFSYRRETAQRNMEDIAPTLREGRALSQALFEPIGRHAAEMTRWMQGWTKRIADLKLTKEESALVQRMGEYRLSADELKNGVTLSDGKPVDTKKINNAIETFRQFYDEALDMANDALIANGYEAVPKRQNYFPHIGEEVTGYDYFVKNILKGEEMALPTSINGITEWFSPGKPWFANFKERQGKATAYDAVRGFEQYLKGVSNVIFLTDDIQRLRTFESALREKYGMPAADESQLDSKTYKGHLSGLASWLHEYTNLLAGKTAKIDRSVEDWFGRRGLTFAKWLKSRFGANAVGANLSTAFSNFIPLTQGIATMNTVDLLSGMKDAAKSMIRNDGFAERSDFLTRRFGDVQKIATTNWQKVKNAAGSAINFPFEKVDQFVAESLVRGKYREELAKGLDADSAMAAADEYAMKTMADRSVGQMPVLFQSKTLGFLTQFQLEVNNQISNTIKDIPRQYMPEKKEWAKAIPEIVKSWLALFVSSYLINEVTEKYITGRRQAADPIHALEELVRDLGITDENGKPQIGTALTNLAENTLDMLPMGNIITGGGRIPLASSIEGASPLDAIKKTLNGDETSGTSWKDFALALATGYLMPAGGAQLKKTVQGIRAAAEGGSYKETPDGKKLKFYTDGDAGDYVRGALFGQYALPGAKEYVESGFKTLSVAETKAFDELRDSGIEPETAESLIYDLREIKSDKKDGKSLNNGTYKKRLLLLEDKDLSKKQKQIIDKNLLATEKRGVADYSSRAWFELWNVSEKTYQKAKKANLEGISPDLFLDLYHKRKELDNEDMKAKEKATEFDLYLREKGVDEYTRTVAEEYFGFYTQIRAEADQRLIDEMMP